MSMLRALDPSFPIERQLAVGASPVILINLFTLNAADEPALLKAWEDDAIFMKGRPGFISTQLHRAIGDSVTYLNYAVWEVHGLLRRRLLASGVRVEALGLPLVGRGDPAPLPEGRSPQRLRRLTFSIGTATLTSVCRHRNGTSAFPLWTPPSAQGGFER